MIPATCVPWPYSSVVDSPAIMLTLASTFPVSALCDAMPGVEHRDDDALSRDAGDAAETQQAAALAGAHLVRRPSPGLEIAHEVGDR